MPVIYIPRVFGGTIVINTGSGFVPSLFVVQVQSFDGNVKAQSFDGNVQVRSLDNTLIAGGS